MTGRKRLGEWWDGLEMRLDRLAEWQQIFNEAWRMERDFYYEPAMHGLDCDVMRDRYGALMPYVSCRQDVQFVIGDLIGELNTSHTYVFDGERRREAESVDVGMLGVDWTVDGRFNGGGLDPDIFLQRLDKEILRYWTRRYSHDQTIPALATRAHTVCLTNRQAGCG